MVNERARLGLLNAHISADMAMGDAQDLFVISYTSNQGEPEQEDLFDEYSLDEDRLEILEERLTQIMGNAHDWRDGVGAQW